MDQERQKTISSFLRRFSIRIETGLDLINASLIHRSYSYEIGLDIDNERLEFLGDSVIGLVTSIYVYEKYPNKDEGELSKMKSVHTQR